MADRKPKIFPCADCGAPDSRDEAHAQGCPTVEPLSDEQVARIYQNVIRLWAEDDERRAEREVAAAREAYVTGIRRARAKYRAYLRAEGARA